MAETWLLDVSKRPSPDHSRRSGKVRVIVLHSTGGAYGGALYTLTARGTGVSAHFLIRRDGKLVQLVPLDRAAWHAGKADWKGYRNVNGISIGIEQEHLDGIQDWPEEQIKALGSLVHRLRGIYGEIPVTSHAEVARPRGRKVDPVDFPWDRLSAAVAAAAKEDNPGG